MRKIHRLDINLASLTEHQTQYSFDYSENPVTEEDDMIRAGRRPAVSRFEGLDHRARHNGTKGLSNHANKTIPGKNLATRLHWGKLSECGYLNGTKGPNLIRTKMNY